jgi:hypothetical protein
MNERIKQLAEQAFDKANNGTISDIKIPKEFIEMFAELIVRECALAGLETHGSYYVHDDILKYFGFGVEE